MPSAAEVLSDRVAHGEGLIAWHALAGLAERGHEVVVCSRSTSPAPDAPFEVVPLGRGSRFESLAPRGYARRARRLHDDRARRKPFDVVHWLYPGEFEEAQFVPPRDTPYVIGPLFARWGGGRGRPFRAGDAVKAVLRPFELRRSERALRRATVLLATPDARLRGRVLSPGVDETRFEAGAPTGETIAFVGRLEVAKGVRELIEAMPAIVRDRPAATLVLAGDGSERDWIERRAIALGVAHAVDLRGNVAPSEIPALLGDAAVLCLPSHAEPYGMVVLEAMAAGRAVVATDDGGPRFLVGDAGGALVPVGDADALARSLVSLLADPVRLATIGRRNRERVEAELSLTRMLDNLEAVYREVTAA